VLLQLGDADRARKLWRSARARHVFRFRGGQAVSLVLLLSVILASYVCVRVGAVAFELTGIPWDQAKFQALSAFSNCGFTTREAEDVVQHPVRRRIATYLIILGNAGVVTTIATFASSLIGANPWRALVNLLSVALCLALVAWLAKRPILASRLRLAVQRWLATRADVPPSMEALLHVDRGYCVTRVTIEAASGVIGQRLSDLRAREHGLQFLGIERGGQFLAIPAETELIAAGDTLIVYAAESALERLFRSTATCG
jgi:hypothetical protein